MALMGATFRISPEYKRHNYDITADGGTSGEGTVFSSAVGLGPFVKTLPTIGRVETNVTIIGTNLTGATGVTFNGVARRRVVEAKLPG